MYTVIAENDESQWSDETGTRYHFPKRYQALLEPGTTVVYYKGRMKNRAFAGKRLSPDPHYFAVAKVARVYPDHSSDKGDLFAEIRDYNPFPKPVPIKQGGKYLEQIPPNRLSNYWRDGVRPINALIHEGILKVCGLKL